MEGSEETGVGKPIRLADGWRLLTSFFHSELASVGHAQRVMPWRPRSRSFGSAGKRRQSRPIATILREDSDESAKDAGPALPLVVACKLVYAAYSYHPGTRGREDVGKLGEAILRGSERDGVSLRTAGGRGFRRAIHARRQPDAVAPGAYHLVFRDVRAGPLESPTIGRSTAVFQFLFNSYYNGVGERFPRRGADC